MPKLTASSDMFTIMHYFSNDGNFAENVYDYDAKEYATALTIEAISPKRPMVPKMGIVLEIQQSTAVGRKAFRETITKFVDGRATVEEESYARELAAAFAEELKSVNLLTKTAMKHFAKSAIVRAC